MVETARCWIGTPFLWQASVRDVGCDCLGLVVGVARDLGRGEANGEFARIADYRRVDPRLLRRGLEATFDPVAGELAAGDILLMRVGGRAQHLAVFAGAGRMIHTYGKGPAQVLEVPMGSTWTRAVDSAWRWRRVVHKRSAK